MYNASLKIGRLVKHRQILFEHSDSGKNEVGWSARLYMHNFTVVLWMLHGAHFHDLATSSSKEQGQCEDSAGRLRHAFRLSSSNLKELSLLDLYVLKFQCTASDNRTAFCAPGVRELDQAVYTERRPQPGYTTANSRLLSSCCSWKSLLLLRFWSVRTWAWSVIQHTSGHWRTLTESGNTTSHLLRI